MTCIMLEVYSVIRHLFEIRSRQLLEITTKSRLWKRTFQVIYQKKEIQIFLNVLSLQR